MRVTGSPIQVTGSPIQVTESPGHLRALGAHGAHGAQEGTGGHILGYTAMDRRSRMRF